MALRYLSVQDQFTGGWLFFQEGMLLLNLAALVPEGGTMVEVGSFTGKSARYLALGGLWSRSFLYCVDPFEGWGEGEEKQGNGKTLEHRVAPIYAAGLLATFGHNLYSAFGEEDSQHIIPVPRKSEYAAKNWGFVSYPSRLTRMGPRYTPGKIDLLFLDGNHERCQEDVDDWLRHLHDHALVVLHDVDNTGRYGPNGPDNTALRMLQGGWKAYGRQINTLALTRQPEFWQLRAEALRDQCDLPSERPVQPEPPGPVATG